MAEREGDPMDRVMLAFQSVMDEFLVLERQVLGQYLSATPVPDDVSEDREPIAATPAAPVAPRKEPTATMRGVLQTVPRPSNGSRAGIAHGHAIVITDDGHGVAMRLAERLRRDGHRVAIVSTTPFAHTRQDSFVSALDSRSDVERLIATIVSACGPIGALVHLLPLNPAPPLEELTVEEWSQRLAIDTKSLFLFSQALMPSLDAAADRGGSAVLAATCGFPGHGGVTGFMKCLALELPRTRTRVIDLDLSESADALVDHLFDELWTESSDVEIGYQRGVRLGIEIADAPAIRDAQFAIPSDAVILATGGARGITADVCLELARRYQPTFVLVGQSALPDAVEPPDISHLTEASDIKRALTTRLRTTNAQVTPAMVERAYQQVIKDREIRDTLGALVSAGSRVHYVALDVKDHVAFGALIDGTYDTYGRIDGVVHGAGIIEDKLIRDKAIESFDRVFATKTTSAFVLAKRLRPASLRFAVFFTSVAGRFGNRGQADYAAGNEVVAKLAGALNQLWPARVCAIHWAPWDKRGMVSPELRREFARRGVELLSVADGRRAFWEEIQQPASAPAEVVVGASARSHGLTPHGTHGLTPTPLLKHATRTSAGGAAVEFVRVLDPAIDHYLNDHKLDNQPVLPLAVATELMAEAAQAVWPDLTVVAVRNLRLLKGIALEAGPLETRITVRAPIHSRDDGCTEADVDITTPSTTPPLRYRALIELAPRLPSAPRADTSVGSLAAFPLALGAAYRRWTFHGPLFQRLTSIDGMGADEMIGHIHSPADSRAVAGVARAGWLIDPFVFDAALQLLLMWSRAHHDKTALPTRFAAFRRFAPLSDTALTAYVHVESSTGGHALKSDVYFVDERGDLRGHLEGMEANCTATLNRLALVGEEAAGAS